jgi:hypothetical protein
LEASATWLPEDLLSNNKPDTLLSLPPLTNSLTN